MSYEPLHHKYRPQTFADLVGQEAIATTLTNAIRTSRIAPAYLFTGPRGTGKTSSARILAKSLNCLKEDKPTLAPCGVCEVCKGIVNGSALDVIEIDAASNTGVDNIREIIERAQFAPVQCRYKVYVIDECLTGDSLVQTSEGLIRIDDPNIKGRKVLSYNDSSGTWEFKKVVRWLDQGERQTLVIKTTNREIRCTGNHLIRTDQGWVAAKNVKEGAKILSPVNVAAEPSSTNLGRMDVYEDLLPDISSKVIPTDKRHKTWRLSFSKLNYFNLCVLAGVEKSLMSLPFCKKKVKALAVYSHTGKDIHIKKDTEFGSLGQKNSFLTKIKLLAVGLQQWAIQQQQSFTQEVAQARYTTTFGWAQTPVENCWQTSNSIPFPQWTTSLETVKSVHLGGVERVYDIEVQDNHNFVANGLLVHNCHMLSTAAFNALLKTLEEPPEHVVFVLATTDPQRVLPTIISRCQRFDFRRIAIDAMVAHLRNIAILENINITQEAVHLVAQVSQGGLRDAESLLDQLSLLSSQVTVERVWDIVGSCSEPDLLGLLQAIAQNNPEAVLDRTRTILERGREPLSVLQNLVGFYRDLLIAKTAPSRSDLARVTPLSWKALCEVADLWDIPSILVGQQHLAKSEVQIKNTTQPRLWLEVTLLGLLSAANIAQQPAVSIQPLVSVPQKGTQQQTVDASKSNITSDGTSHQHPPQPPAITTAQPPVQQENLQPAIAQVADTLRSIPEQALVEPSPSTSVVNSATDTPREQVWQQVLANLQPNSTQALLRQMGHLVQFDGTVAHIGMKSPAWCNQAKAYLPNIRAAFQETFKREVEVRIELATSLNQNRTAPVKELHEQAPQPQSSLGTRTTQATSPQIAEPVITPRPVTSSFPAGIIAGTEPQKEANISESPATDLATSAPAISDESEEDEVVSAAQSLADFFKGEVISFKDGLAFPKHIETSVLPPQPPQWQDSEEADEEDIDF